MKFLTAAVTLLAAAAVHATPSNEVERDLSQLERDVRQLEQSESSSVPRPRARPVFGDRARNAHERAQYVFTRTLCTRRGVLARGKRTQR